MFWAATPGLLGGVGLDGVLGGLRGVLGDGILRGVGALGIWGSNRPEKIMPFFVVSTGALALDVVRIVTGVVASGALLATGTDTLLDLVYTGSCAWLAWKVWRQPRELVDKGLIARQ